MCKNFFFFLIAGLMLTTCKDNKNVQKEPEQNPFLVEWDTPFQTPPFEKIKNEHYLPAFNEAIKQQQAEIDAIVNNTETPTFENTLVAFDKSGELLDKVSRVFFCINGANTNDEIQKIAQEVTPLLTQHSDNISLNAKLFEKIKTVYEQKDKLNLGEQEARLLEIVYKDFVREGANLSDEQKDKLRKINTDIAAKQLLFSQNALAENNGFKLIIDKKENLKGLPQSVIDGAADMAKANKQEGKWMFSLQNASALPFFQYADNRDLRQQLYTAYINRGNNNNKNDNKQVVKDILNLRIEKAKVLGYETFADYVLADRMAKNPKNVLTLLNQIWTPALATAKKELHDLQELSNTEGNTFTLENYDWMYFSEKLKKQKYDVDEELTRQYFSLDNVTEGIFYVSNKLYGITFKKRDDISVYHPEISVYECNDKDGSLLCILYLDFHPRESKRSGAWCTSFRKQSYKDGKRVAPIVSIVCNFTKPTGDKPALLTIDETETYFHEFGHGLHGMLQNVKYTNIASVPRDFVELPSQIMEHWASQPEVLKVYAKHYKTNEVIPQELLDKLDKSSKYGLGFATTELTAAALLDMDYHILTDAKNLDVLAFEKEKMEKIGLIKQIPPRYRSTYFSHVWGGGYAVGYYSYLWSEVLDADAFEAFKEKGNIFDQETATKFRTCILERGGIEDAAVMYKKFRGKDPQINPLLKNRGFR